MQLGSLEDLKQCQQIPYVDDICAFMQKEDCRALPVGDIFLRGHDLFVRVGAYVSAPQEDRPFETHRIYADVQCIVDGTEMIGTTEEKNLRPLAPYDVPKDIQFFQAPLQIRNYMVSAGTFALFLPGEAHQPGCIYQSPMSIKKLVFKVKMT